MFRLIKTIKHLLKYYYFRFSPFKFNSLDKYWIKKNKEEIFLDKYDYCIFISSRNNYSMLKNLVLNNFKIKNLDFYNVDDNSTNEEIKKGENICDKNNIIFLRNKSKGLQMGLQTLLKYFENNNKKYKFILYISHDNFPISNNFFYNFNSFINNNNFENIGCVGFNHLDYKFHKKEIKQFKKNSLSIGFLGRAFLTSLDKSKIPSWYTNKNTNNFQNINLNQPVSVEGVADMAFAINLSNLKKFINLSDKYRLHCWADDICIQFLSNNIYNIAVPQFIFYNAMEIKAKYKILTSSVHSPDKNTKFHSEINAYKKYWIEKWNWDRDYLPNIQIIKKYYSNTLIEKFTEHNFSQGSLKSFKFKI